MKSLLVLFFVCTIAASCDTRKIYKYVEVQQDSYLGSTNLKEQPVVEIKENDDSSAYLAAFQKFYIAKKSIEKVNKTIGSQALKAVSFKLLNDAGTDISNTTFFVTKREKEKGILELIDNLESNTANVSSDTVHPKIDSASSEWITSDKEDKMGDHQKIAMLISTNEIDLKFPYDGGVSSTFAVRKKRSNTDIYLEVDKGQFNNTFDGGHVRIRFDNAAPSTYYFTGASDGSSNIIFLNAVSSIIAKLKTAKKMIIEAEFYDNGFKQMEFNVQGFRW